MVVFSLSNRRGSPRHDKVWLLETHRSLSGRFSRGSPGIDSIRYLFLKWQGFLNDFLEHFGFCGCLSFFYIPKMFNKIKKNIKYFASPAYYVWYSSIVTQRLRYVCITSLYRNRFTTPHILVFSSMPRCSHTHTRIHSRTHSHTITNTGRPLASDTHEKPPRKRHYAAVVRVAACTAAHWVLVL